MTVKLCVDWSGMGYLPTGSSDLILFFGCMTSNFLYLSFSTLYSSSLLRTDTIVFSKLNKPPSPLSPPSNGLEMNMPPKGLIEGLQYFLRNWWCDQHVTSTGQRKNLIPWQESNLCMTWSDALTTELQSTRGKLGHIQGSCMTCILRTDRINNQNYHVCDK